MQKITPFLWFNDNAEQAVDFYVSVFKDARKGEIARQGEAGAGQNGQVMTVTFELFGQNFIALNGGPQFSFNESISFVVDCTDQAEVDYYWEKLSDGGQQSVCGWVKDKFGLWWQVVPSVLPKLMTLPDRQKAERVMRAMMGMSKIDIARLEEAAAINERKKLN